MPKQVFFDRSLYLPEAVLAAAAAYRELATIEITQSGDGCSALIPDVPGHDIEAVAHAFCNHVLYESIVMLRQAAVREVAG